MRLTVAAEFKPELCFDETTGRWFLKLFANPNSYQGAKMITESSLAEMGTRIKANKPFIYWGNLNMEERLAFLGTTHRTLSRLSSCDTCDQTLDDVIKAQEHEVQRLKDMKAERDTVTSARFYPTEADPIPHPKCGVESISKSPDEKVPAVVAALEQLADELGG